MKKILCLLFCALLGTAAYSQNTINDKGYIISSSYDGVNFYCEDDVLFLRSTRNSGILVKYPQSKIGSTYTVPSWVTTIAKGAFQGNRYIATIRIPSSIYSIGDNAFEDLSSLKSIEIYESTSAVRSIDNNDAQAEAKEVGRYNIQGVKIEEGKDGQIQIILYSDGTAKKVIE